MIHTFVYLERSSKDIQFDLVKKHKGLFGHPRKCDCNVIFFVLYCIPCVISSFCGNWWRIGCDIFELENSEFAFIKDGFDCDFSVYCCIQVPDI